MPAPGPVPARRARASRAAPDLSVCDRWRPRTSLAFLREVVRTTLSFLARPAMPVSLLLTDDAEITRLHARHLGDPTPTDVISFEVDGGAEIAISVETALRTARQHGHSPRAEVALYVVHGLLHTSGFDDIRARDRARMRAAERTVMQRLRLRVHAVDA
ncbi:MAG TPA: rRNA maturation RNase YbeY [Planctomycetota bacterium]